MLFVKTKIAVTCLTYHFLSYRFLRIAPLCYSKTSTRFQRVSMKTGRNFIRYSSFQYFQITPFTIRYRIVALGESSSSANTRHSKTDFNASSRCLTFLVMNIAVLECSTPMYDIPIMPKFFSLQFSLGSPPFREPLRGSLRYINCSNSLHRSNPFTYKQNLHGNPLPVYYPNVNAK